MINFLNFIYSYDERLLLWDKRLMKSPTKECGLGGGVWKLKWQSSDSFNLLAATMHNGFHVVSFHGAEGLEVEVVASYRQHSSLAYGCDWSRLNSTTNQLIASCSFYDHSLHVWKISD